MAIDTPPGRDAPPRAWGALWPKLAAFALALAVWQVLAWSNWRPPYALPPPSAAFRALRAIVSTAGFWSGVVRTMRRAIIGYGIALALGSVTGVAVARLPRLRVAVASLITGLQTMPSIAWFPLAILLFQLSENAILLVVVLGAAPSIANGIIAGVDHIPPIVLRAGHMVGARGAALYRHVVFPAALPSIVSGLKQGWAFAWRSLMAGELLVIVPGRVSIGTMMQNARDNNDAPGLVAIMIVILVLGVSVDAVFSRLDTSLRRRRGLLVEA